MRTSSISGATEPRSEAAGQLTKEQEAIVSLPPGARALVTAGAGSGKTHTLAARVSALIAEGVAPGSELQVLSFSRAAVDEVRRRLAAAGGDARYLSIATFDSFASQVLGELDPLGSWTEQAYDPRIVACTRLIAEQGREAPSIGACRHVIIDEAQDLVDVRADFVRALLEACAGGFTIFEDPAQSIYEHQVNRGGRGSADLRAWLRKHFRPDLQEFSLSRNFRARADVTRLVLEYGPRLQVLEPDYPGVRHDMETLLLGLPWAGDLELLAPNLTGRAGTAAFLTRNNGEALLVSRRLDDLRVPHRLQRKAAERVVHKWLAEAVMYWPSPRVGRHQVLSRLESITDRLPMAPDAAWALCKQLDQRRTQDLDLVAVAHRLRAGSVPQQFTEAESSRISVSTIHRAKGLEFDSVVLTEPGPPRDGADLGEETRVLYVALTRARDEILVMKRPDTRGMLVEQSTGRWISRSVGGTFGRIVAAEILGEDVHSGEPAGAYALENCDVQTTQAYMRSSVRPGDPIQLELHCASLSGNPGCIYRLVHAGNTVGVTGEAFSERLCRILRIRQAGSRAWPARISALRVECVDTVTGNSQTGNAHGLGVAGVWLRVRVQGLGRFVSDG